MFVPHPGVGIDARPAISAALAQIVASGTPGLVELEPGAPYELHSWDADNHMLELYDPLQLGIASAESGAVARITTAVARAVGQRMIKVLATSDDLSFVARDLELRHEFFDFVESGSGAGQAHAIMAVGDGPGWVSGFDIERVTCHVSNGDAVVCYDGVEEVTVRGLAGDCGRNVLSFNGDNGGRVARSGIDIDGLTKISGPNDRGIPSIVLDFEPAEGTWFDDVSIRNVRSDSALHLFFLRGALIERVKASKIICGGVQRSVMRRLDLVGEPGPGGNSAGVTLNLIQGWSSDFVVERSRLAVPSDGAYPMSLRNPVPGTSYDVTLDRCDFVLPAANTLHHPNTWKNPAMRDCRIERY